MSCKNNDKVWTFGYTLYPLLLIVRRVLSLLWGDFRDVVHAAMQLLPLEH